MINLEPSRRDFGRYIASSFAASLLPNRVSAKPTTEVSKVRRTVERDEGLNNICFYFADRLTNERDANYGGLMSGSSRQLYKKWLVPANQEDIEQVLQGNGLDAMQRKEKIEEFNKKIESFNQMVKSTKQVMSIDLDRLMTNRMTFPTLKPAIPPSKRLEEYGELVKYGYPIILDEEKIKEKCGKELDIDSISVRSCWDVDPKGKKSLERATLIKLFELGRDRGAERPKDSKNLKEEDIALLVPDWVKIVIITTNKAMVMVDPGYIRIRKLD